jgi:predicted dehydrogenase
MKNVFSYLLLAIAASFLACNGSSKSNKTEEKQSMFTGANGEIKFITLDPGHFHAALVQKNMYDQVSPDIFVYAPEGAELQNHLKIIDGYNARKDNPTKWNLKVCSGDDYLERMLAEKPGNVVVISGNNRIKTDYIRKSVEAGLNVLADKPMVITPEKFGELEKTFKTAKEKGVLLYDLMPERYEVNVMLQKELSSNPEVFGALEDGTLQKPATEQICIHHFYKTVSGNALVRPAWFFDVNQQGEGIVDIATHYVDLVQWSCFPNQIINKNDIEIISAKHWPTLLSITEFSMAIQLREYPDFLARNAKKGNLNVFSNGEIIYKIKGKVAKVSVEWKFKAPEGAGDSHYSVMRGTLCSLEIRQGMDERFEPTLYITANEGTDVNLFAANLSKAIRDLPQKNIVIQKVKSNVWKAVVPKELRIEHEERFAIVVKKYLEYLKNGNIPEWETSGMITKYYTTTEALKLVLK